MRFTVSRRVMIVMAAWPGCILYSKSIQFCDGNSIGHLFRLLDNVTLSFRASPNLILPFCLG